jgi:hypothetical protein
VVELVRGAEDPVAQEQRPCEHERQGDLPGSRDHNGLDSTGQRHRYQSHRLSVASVNTPTGYPDLFLVYTTRQGGRSTPGTLFTNCLVGKFSEVRRYGVLRSSPKHHSRKYRVGPVQHL